jgi:FkbH-like protein
MSAPPTLIATHLLRAPNDLQVTPTPPRRVLIVGSCLSGDWSRRMKSLANPCESDHYLQGRPLPDQPAHPIGEYDFQMVQLGLRFVLPDNAFARLSQTDTRGHEDLFRFAVSSMRAALEDAMRWNREHGILTFVFPFVTPVQNPVGRLMPRYDLRNPVYFIERLNEALAGELGGYSNAYFFDFNEVLASYGKVFVQEDMYSAINHGAFLGVWDYKFDQNRLEPALKATDFFISRVPMVFHATWQELTAMWRSIRQVDMVKMVIVDLDDTLWRGVTADLELSKLPTTEGWPKGLWEALTFLRRRGVLLGIISKNDEQRVRGFWRQIFGRQMKLEDFAIIRINWKPKAENMAEMLAHVNLLARNVVYIDDNPVERAALKAAFPELRVLGGTPLTWRRLLLWSGETQLPDITAESASRTDMVRAQVQREENRAAMPREDFLASLNVRMTVFTVDSMEHARFPRVIELINKTNQFNTTGKRWSREECQAAFAGGWEFYAFEVADRYTEYGLVGVLLVDGNSIRQFVMSCRVMGLLVEEAAVARVVGILRARGRKDVRAALVETERNLPCRDVYMRCGFLPAPGGFACPPALSLPVPKHIRLMDGEKGGAELTEAAE